MSDRWAELEAERAARLAQVRGGKAPGRPPRAKTGGRKRSRSPAYPGRFLRGWYAAGALAKLSPGARGLYPVLLLLADLKKRLYSAGGLGRLAAACGGVHRNTVARWLRELVAHGMIKKQSLRRSTTHGIKSALLVYLQEPPKPGSGDGRLDGMGESAP